MKIRLILGYLTLIICAFCVQGCKKYLEAKSDASLSTPSTIEDLQAMLDGGLVNYGIQITNIASDEYILDYTNWLAWFPDNSIGRLGHIWDAETNDLSDWARFYNCIFIANSVLDNIPKISEPGGENWNDVRGQALFHRARCFFELAQVFAEPYVASTANTKLGVPLRLSSDFNELTARSTVQQTYDRILQDLVSCLSLLPNMAHYKNRPGKVAAYALLAKVYLVMAKYSEALDNAEAALGIYDSLLDYKSVPITGNYSFQRYNAEVIFHASVDAVNGYSGVEVDTTLYNSFASSDLRKLLFFDANRNYIGSYSGNFLLFNGIAVDELYLIKAECIARSGNMEGSMQALNSLLAKRHDSSFINLTAESADQALHIILEERYKELINRGTRWSDLRRLNKDVRFKKTLKRTLNGQSFVLLPDDLRYTWLIPIEVINLTGIPQNTR